MDLLPAEQLVKPVADHDDLTQFIADIGFVRDEKALSEDEYAKYSDKLSDGDLLIAGWGANFELDRENESFAEGAFDRGLKSFLNGEATLAYHHKHDHVLGRVLDAERVEGKGVRIVARVDNQPESSPLRHLYDQVKKGTLNGLSCGGFFKRGWEQGTRKITDVDLTEWSITGVPVGRGANFAVVAGKALGDSAGPEDSELGHTNIDLSAIDGIFSRLDDIFASVDGKALPSSHDPAAADAVAGLIDKVQKTRERATSIRSYSEHEDVVSHADALESDLAGHESKLHRLAAKVGPLPNYNY